MIELGIGEREQFKNIFWLLKNFMTKKYEDFNDPAIQETLEWWKTHEISVFNQHVQIVDGEIFVENLLTEQLPTSPHLYTTDEHKVHAGDVLIDAGVCEGNFALKYVDICSKIYLFELDEDWQEPLRQTFKNYRDKVEIIPRFVSDVTDEKNITIDDALLGAKKLFTNNKIRASVAAAKLRRARAI